MAEDLWQIRQRKGMSLGQLAIRSGIHTHTLEAYEAGRPMTAAHRAKLAKILYVDERDIRLQSTPRPKKTDPNLDQPALPEAGPLSKAPKPRKEPKPPPPPGPVRPGQIQTLQALARHFHLTPEQMESQIGKSFSELTYPEAKTWIKQYQGRITTTGLSVPEGYRHKRGYLPESVDDFEVQYLTTVQQSGDPLSLKMFNGETFNGTLIGFGPYTLTLRLNDGSEVTLQKLAVAYYRRETGAAP